MPADIADGQTHLPSAGLSILPRLQPYVYAGISVCRAAWIRRGRGSGHAGISGTYPIGLEGEPTRTTSRARWLPAGRYSGRNVRRPPPANPPAGLGRLPWTNSQL